MSDVLKRAREIAQRAWNLISRTDDDDPIGVVVNALDAAGLLRQEGQQQVIANDPVRLACVEAVRLCNSTANNVFNGACFSKVLTRMAGLCASLDGRYAFAILSGRSDIEVLSGGAHYRLLDIAKPEQLRVMSKKEMREIMADEMVSGLCMWNPSTIQYVREGRNEVYAADVILNTIDVLHGHLATPECPLVHIDCVSCSHEVRKDGTCGCPDNQLGRTRLGELDDENAALKKKIEELEARAKVCEPSAEEVWGNSTKSLGAFVVWYNAHIYSVAEAVRKYREENEWPKYVCWKGSKSIIDIRRLDGPGKMVHTYKLSGEEIGVCGDTSSFINDLNTWLIVPKAKAEAIIAEAQARAFVFQTSSQKGEE